MSEPQPGVHSLYDSEPPVDLISHQASTWFALFANGGGTPEQRAAWQVWMQADQRHTQAYVELERLWQLSAGLPMQALPAPVAQLSRRRFVQFAAVASAAAVVAGPALWLSGARLPLADRATAIGERRSERLPDGTLVELAGDSAFDFEISATRRWLHLLRGEAFLQVAGDTAQPFRVEVAGGSVTTMGADFCLACSSDSVAVSVSQQSVAVSVAGQQAELHAGQALDFSAGRLGTIRRAALDQALAWRSDRLVFFDTPLGEVADNLQRWRPGKIVIADAQLARRPVSLILNLQQPERILDVLAQALPIRVSSYSPWLTVIRPA